MGVSFTEINGEFTEMKRHSRICGVVLVLVCVLASAGADAQASHLIAASSSGDLSQVKALLAAQADSHTNPGPAQNQPPARASTLPSESELDALVAARNWGGLSTALSRATDGEPFRRKLEWLRSRLSAVFLAQSHSGICPCFFDGLLSLGFEHRQVLRQLPVCLLGRLKFDFLRVHLR